MSDYRWISCADTAKLVRAELRKAFPSTTFSVRSKSYAGGASISIGWTDGPTVKRVDEIVGSFEGKTFDGMTDMASSVIGQFNGERVRFGADYIHTNRKRSPALIERAARAVAAFYGIEMPTFTVDKYENVIFDVTHPSYRAPNLGRDFDTLVYRATEDRTTCTWGE